MIKNENYPFYFLHGRLNPKQKMREIKNIKSILERGHKLNCQCSCCKIKRGEKKGKNHPNWKGGQFINGQGYVLVLMPNHPRAMKSGYIRRSHLVAEKMLGRYLYPWEIPHHENEIRNDDRPENIEIMESRSAHSKYHMQLKKLK